MKSLISFLGAVIMMGSLVVASVVTPSSGSRGSVCGSPIGGRWGTFDCTQQLTPIAGLAAMMLVVGSVALMVGFHEPSRR